MRFSKKFLEKGIKKSLFLKSFKSVRKRAAYAMLIEAAFILAVVGIVFLSISGIRETFMSLEDLSPTLYKINALAINEPGLKEEVEHAASALQMIIAKAAIIAAGAAISTIVLMALAKAFVWLNVQWKKLETGYIKRFFLAILLWISLWIAAGVAFSILFVWDISKWILIVLALLYFHFSAILQATFDKNKGIWSQFKESIVFGSKKVHRFIVPYLLILVVMDIAFVPGYLTSFATNNFKILGPVHGIFFVIFFNWARVYINSTIKELA